VNDGNDGTSWRDYYNYRIEIYDANDWDNDGVPDLTDPDPGGAVTEGMPWLLCSWMSKEDAERRRQFSVELKTCSPSIDYSPRSSNKAGDTEPALF